ncbi:serine hydrolase [Negadavirga shengliensis]|uniref:beta-lactamase n=1 Tax=Negadavirga shengliensis TaxID=1389218 RepID=A0ABV9T3D7_9BACT
MKDNPPYGFHTTLAVIYTLLFLQASFCQTSAQENIKAYLNHLPPHIEISCTVQRGDGTVLFSHQAEKQVPSASIIKVPILFYLMEAVGRGEVDLDEIRELQEEDKAEGSGQLQLFPAGSRFTLRYLAEEMIRISDNTATNILINILGMENIQQWLKGQGFHATQLNRLMMDFEAIEAGRQNYTSAKEINRLFLMLINEDFLSPEYRDEAIHLLKSCADGTAFRRYLPPETEMAHKTGTLDYIRADAGIIFMEKPLVMAVFVEGFKTLEEAEVIIGQFAKMALEDFKEN